MATEIRPRFARAALRISLGYGVVAGLWILLSDSILPLISKNPEVLARMAIVKGLLFVTVTTALLYWVVKGVMGKQAVELSARQKVETKLRESEEQLRILMDQASDAFFVHEPGGKFVDVNRRACESLGYTREELLKMNIPDIEQDLSPAEAEKLCRSVKPGGTLTAYGHHRRKDGTVLPVEVRLSSCDFHGKQLVLALARDITERLQAQADVQKRLELEERLSKITASVPGVIYAFKMEPDGRMSFPYAAPAIREIFGIAAEQLMADAEAGFQMLLPQDWIRVRRTAVDSARELTPWREEFRVRHPANGEIWVEGMATPQAQVDGSVLWHGFMHDITERKHNEELQARLATAVEQAAEAIVITDPSGIILYVNPAFERVTGFLEEEVLGKNPRILKSGEHGADFYKEMWMTLTSGRVWTGRMVNKKKDDTFYHEEMTVSPVFDAVGKLVNYVAVKKDVTREVELEEQLRQSQKMEAIGQLAGGVAHDFNNILTVIQGNASLLMGTSIPPNFVLECAGQISGAAERAANLTRQLLLFSRKQALQATAVELNEVVTGMTKLLRRLLGEDIIFHCEFAPHVPMVLADPGMMEQVLLNLAVNARDAMPDGGKLTVATLVRTWSEAEAEEKPDAVAGRSVCLSVTDTGSGISPEILPRIFEPFFTTKEAGKGTGLGLATVHGIVKQHRGWIEVSSETGVGTTFRIWLPAFTGRGEGTAPAENSPGMQRGTETLLVVEDEKSLRELVAGLLTRCGYQVHTAETGVAALKIWKEHRSSIRLLLTDMVMPGGITGRQLAEQLQQDKPGLRVIYTSGYSTELGSEPRLVQGANFLQKPYSPTVLTKVIRDSLDLR